MTQTLPLSSRGPAVGEVTAPIRELLAWVARSPRTYADVMAAWRSSCPRFTVWEDALDAGLIQIERRGETGDTLISLTPHGQAVLGGP
jgi:hypothetical protein